MYKGFPHVTVYLYYLCQHLLSKWHKCWSALLSSLSIILQTWMQNNLGIDWIIVLAALFMKQSNTGHNTNGTGLSVAKGRKIISWQANVKNKTFMKHDFSWRLILQEQVTPRDSSYNCTYNFCCNISFVWPTVCYGKVNFYEHSDPNLSTHQRITQYTRYTLWTALHHTQISENNGSLHKLSSWTFT